MLINLRSVLNSPGISVGDSYTKGVLAYDIRLIASLPWYNILQQNQHLARGRLHTCFVSIPRTLVPGKPAKWHRTRALSNIRLLQFSKITLLNLITLVVSEKTMYITIIFLDADLQELFLNIWCCSYLPPPKTEQDLGGIRQRAWPNL